MEGSPPGASRTSSVSGSLWVPFESTSFNRRETFLIDDIKLRHQLQPTRAFKNQMENKRREVQPEFYGTRAMIDRTWTEPNFELRHVVNRMAIHGFHHLICTNKTYHNPTTACICELCNKVCERYHYRVMLNKTKNNK